MNSLIVLLALFPTLFSSYIKFLPEMVSVHSPCSLPGLHTSPIST